MNLPLHSRFPELHLLPLQARMRFIKKETNIHTGMSMHNQVWESLVSGPLDYLNGILHGKDYWD